MTVTAPAPLAAVPGRRPAWSFRGDMQLIKGYFTGALSCEVAAVRLALGLRADQRTLADAR